MLPVPTHYLNSFLLIRNIGMLNNIILCLLHKHSLNYTIFSEFLNKCILIRISIVSCEFIKIALVIIFSHRELLIFHDCFHNKLLCC